MKDILELFIYKPKKTERMIIQLLKVLFALSYTVWAYQEIGVPDIKDQVGNYESLKKFIIEGHVVLFLFTFYLIYQAFYRYLRPVFSAVGMLSYWIAWLVFIIVLNNILNTVGWLVARLRRKKRKFRLTYKIDLSASDDFFAFAYSMIKKGLVKADLLKSKEQTVRSSKQMITTMNDVRTVMVKNSAQIYTRIYTIFIFAALLFVYYFFYLKKGNNFIPQLDMIVGAVCVVIMSVQVLLYWLYNNFRLIYYFYLTLYRGIHRRDLIEKEMKEFMNLWAEEMDAASKVVIEGNDP